MPVTMSPPTPGGSTPPPAPGSTNRPMVSNTSGGLLVSISALGNSGNPATDMNIESVGVAWTAAPAVRSPIGPQHDLTLSAFVVAKEKVSGELHSVGIHVNSPDGSTTPRLTLWCGNDWMSGGVGAADRERILSAVEQPIRSNTQAVKAIQAELSASYGSRKDWAGTCGFAVGKGGKNPYQCDHSMLVAKEFVQGSNAEIRDLYGKLGAKSADEFLDNMIKVWNSAQHTMENPAHNSSAMIHLFLTQSKSASSTGPKKRAAPARILDSERILGDRIEIEQEQKKRGRIFAEILRSASVQLNEPKARLLVGPAGWGKTHAATEIGQAEHPSGTKLFDAMHLIKVQPGWEAHNLIGGLGTFVQDGQQRFDSVDGPLVAAVRDAQKMRTLIILDEYPNLNKEATNLFKASLNKEKGFYSLDTATLDELTSSGRRRAERISYPVKNAVFVLTGNAGEGFDSFMGDDAVKSRMHLTHIGPTREDAILSGKNDPMALKSISESKGYLLSVAGACLANRGFSSGPSRAIEAIFDNNIAMVRSDELSRILCVRNVADAINCAGKERDIPALLGDEVTYLAAELPGGVPDPKQVNTARMLVAKAFGKAKPEDLFP